MIHQKSVRYMPSLSMDSMCHIRDIVGDEAAQDKTIIALVFLHGSWNAPRRRITEHQQQPILTWNQSLLQSLLAASSAKRNNDELVYVAGTLQVDQSDESIACCLGDDDFDVATANSLPCPPDTLPVLAVAIQTPAQTHARVKYLSELSSSEVLSHMSQPNTSSNLIVQQASELFVLQNGPLSGWTKTIQSRIDELLLDITTNSSNRSGDEANNNNNNNTQSSQMRAKGSSQQQQDDTPNTHDNDSSASAIRIFVAGDRSSVGKSSVCLGILGSLVRKFGYSPSSLAYIKPATQCEAPQLVEAYCDSVGIACNAVGPLVYYKGFTRAFLAGETGQTTQDLLADCGQAVDAIAKGKRIVLVDGVGFPAVGSICGTDNASVAKACGYPSSTISDNDDNSSKRHPPGVIVVGGSGVGAAVDAFNLNATYFEAGQVPVMGGIFNKLATEGYYSLENCKQQLTAYFQQNEHQQRHGRIPFAFVPLFDALGEEAAIKRVDEFIQIFGEHVDIQAILESAKRLKQQYSGDDSAMEIDSPVTKECVTIQIAPPKKRFKSNAVAVQNDSSGRTAVRLSRIEIEKLASRQGAATS